MAGKASKWKGGKRPDSEDAHRDARKESCEEYFCEYCGRVIYGRGIKAHLRHIREEYVRGVAPRAEPLPRPLFAPMPAAPR